MTIFSNKQELEKIRDVLTSYIRLPFSDDTIPGAIMEGVIAHVRAGAVLKNYHFIDVSKPSEKVGWQVKATKADTPLTWKRAKIPSANLHVKNSHESAKGRQALGNAIIDFCNKHAQESLSYYNLDAIGYSRLVIFDNKEVLYFEKELCNRKNTKIFQEDDFEWHWSKPKETTKKEQLPAFHGTQKSTGQKWWAWHGLAGC